MKKIVAFILSLTMLMSLTACGTEPATQPAPSTTASEPSVSQREEPAPSTSSETDEESDANNTLVVYFSLPETDDPNDMTEEEENSTVIIDGEVLGNTQYMAYVIQEQVGADIFRIEAETPYPLDHDTLVDQAAEEQDQQARPAIASQVENMEDYNVVYLGYPNWWGDMPMILYTFLEEYDLSGKTIIPFNTHGGSGFSRTIDTIRELEPEAAVLDGLSISRNSIQDAEQEIVNWVRDIQSQIEE